MTPRPPRLRVRQITIHIDRHSLVTITARWLRALCVLCARQITTRINRHVSITTTAQWLCARCVPCARHMTTCIDRHSSVTTTARWLCARCVPCVKFCYYPACPNNANTSRRFGMELWAPRRVTAIAALAAANRNATGINMPSWSATAKAPL